MSVLSHCRSSLGTGDPGGPGSRTWVVGFVEGTNARCSLQISDGGWGTRAAVHPDGHKPDAFVGRLSHCIAATEGGHPRGDPRQVGSYSS